MADPKSLQEILQKEQLNINQQEKGGIDYENENEVSNYLKNEFPGIKPKPIDFFKGKLHAYKVAAQREISERDEEKKRLRRENFNRMWTFEEMANQAFMNGKAIGISQGFDFVLDQYNKPVFDLLCKYFTNDPDFEDNGFGDVNYSLDKGIWLQSAERGPGKSALLKAFYINKRSCFGYKHTTELAVMFQKKGFDAIDPFIGTLPQSPSALNFYQNECGFMYDEMFSEDKVNHMGSPLSISSYIVNKLYDFSNNYKDKKFKFHCTSNMDGSDIEATAGKTFRSRMKDMFNIIKLEGPDRRGMSCKTQ